ncbi:MAG: hypothetical protein JXQ23_04080 [Clostridia bacterium]|nr:hypothetical protein [Clostridia bacterium]
MKDRHILIDELSELRKDTTPDRLLRYVKDNMNSLFASAEMTSLYRMLKDVDTSASHDELPGIIISWMAFACGDNREMFQRMQHIRETDLKTPQESSLFYSLKAMIEGMMNKDNALKYSRLAYDILPLNEKSIFMANAQLTYAQVLAGTDQYSKAADFFSSSHHIFNELKMNFLAMVALVNELLNRFRMGEISYVINRSQEALFMSGSFHDETKSYSEVANLPAGMSYHEINKQNLAIKHLSAAKKSIDDMGMLHMHGVTEMYLFRSYYILDDQQNMEKILNEVITRFGHMNYRQMDILIATFKILLHKYNHQPIESEMEMFEIEDSKPSLEAQFMVNEMKTYITLCSYRLMISSQDILENLDQFRASGNMTKLQATFIQLAELSNLEGNKEQATLYLKQAVDIYREYDMLVNFLFYPMTLTEEIRAMDRELHRKLSETRKTNHQIIRESLLTSREKEILKLISLGKSNSDIGKDLFISVGTIKWHINNIFSKLHAENRIQAVKKAKELNEI